MKAFTIIPQKKREVSIKEILYPQCKDNEVIVKVLEAGICKTDIEIFNGLYGETPKEENYLIMGHESLGQVMFTGKSVQTFKQGDLVVRTVRRPCNKCINCKSGENDMCLTGEYLETGIKGLHGIMVEYYVEDPNFLIMISEKYREVGVLLEPLSFSEKAIRQVFEIQKRMKWEPKKALVIGAGPIGLLLTMVLRNKGLNTHVCAWSLKGNIKSKIAEEVGATYISIQETNLESLGKFDIVIEASGSVDRIKESFSLISTNGVLCLTSITGGRKKVELPLEEINLDVVLGNKTIVGVVNANISDYKTGLKDLNDFEKKWPGTTKKLITKRIKFPNITTIFEREREDIKTVLEFV